MSVNSYLIQISRNLDLNSREKTSIKKSINTLQKRLDLYFGQSVTDHFQFGSSTRETVLPVRVDTKADIDYMIVFNVSKGKEKPQRFIDQLLGFVSAEYTASKIHKASPRIILSLDQINFELVPAVYEGGAYKIPSQRSYLSEWMPTDPAGFKKNVLDKNRENHNNIKPLIKLLKYWNASKDHPLTSFSIEKYIVNRYFLFCSSLKDYFYSFWDDISFNHDTAHYINELIENAKKHVGRAREYEKDNKPKSAEKEIKKIVPEL